MEPVQEDGLEFVSHWFGEDSYSPGDHYWLHLYKDSSGRAVASLRGFRGAKLLEVTRESCEDAAGYLVFDGIELTRMDDGHGMWIKPEIPEEKAP